MPSTTEVLASLHLNALRDVGPARFQKLIGHFGSAENALRAGPLGWRGIPLFDTVVLDRIAADWASGERAAGRDAEAAARWGVEWFFLHDGFYPSRLREIASPPPVLYVQGKNFDLNATSVALVGSRRSSYYAERTARTLAEELAHAGVVTISGLARGIDTCVHQSTLQAQGQTLAVLGSGLSFVYPAENKKLSEAIRECGALISEFPMSARPHPSSFPRRNRIISGLSLGTVVVEGSAKSGSLITARLAADQGREVMAVPGPVGATGSAAPHLLIKAGAALIECADDILDAIGLARKSKINSVALTEDQSPWEFVLCHLGPEPLSREILAERLRKSAAELSSIMLELELQGLIRCLPSGGVVKT